MRYDAHTGIYYMRKDRPHLSLVVVHRPSNVLTDDHMLAFVAARIDRTRNVDCRLCRSLDPVRLGA
jgi:hypothetical protein